MKQISRTLFLLFLSVFCLSPCYTTLIAQQTPALQKAPLLPQTDGSTQEKPSSNETSSDDKSKIEEWKKDTEEHATDIEESHFGVLFIRMVLMLGITLLIAVLIVWIAKRLMQGRQLGGSKSNRLQIIERRQLSPKAALYLIMIDSHELVIGESATGLHVIKTMSDER
ncbi:MAG TPA: flagellar biosynthetic protein FliO [Chlamydiales bacterium]|nr:flagellar biosynthetic protein FliO [Chlamydiales bacterium]